MRESFEVWWEKLPERLRPGTTIKNWTQFSGYTGKNFTFTEIDRDGAFVVDPPLRRISKEDFRMVYSIWDAYCDGGIPRNRIRDATVNSKYIISVLRWLDKNQGE